MLNVKRGSMFYKITSFMVALIMCFSSCVNFVFGAETITNGEWTIVNEDSSGIAQIKELNFTYYSPTTVFEYGSSGGKYYVKSKNTNGSVSNGIVVTNGKGYCEYPATKDGTLTVFVGNAPTKTGYVSKKEADGKDIAIGEFVPGVAGSYDKDDFKVTQGTTWATLDIEVESGCTYYICVNGSKMLCYGAEFTPYTEVTGNITDSFNISDFGIKFTNQETDKITYADVDTTNKTYSVKLKPGYTYSAGLTGPNAAFYTVSSATRGVVPTGEAMTADITIDKCLTYEISGTLSGFAEDYNLDDLVVKFVPKDINDFETVTVDLNKENLTYSALLVSDEEYTLQKTGANDYDFTETITVKNTVENGSEVEEPEYIYGDVSNNGAVEVNDAAIMLQKVLNTSYKLPIEEVNENYMEFADVDSDGILTAKDSAYILKKALDTSFYFPNGKNNRPSASSKIEQDVSFKLVDTYLAEGKFIGLTQERGVYENLDVNVSAITFKNLADSYTYNASVSQNGYSVKLRNGDYIASINCENYSTTTHVVIDNAQASKDLLLKFEGNISIDYTDTLYVGKDKEYKTVQAAVDAVSKMTRTDGQRVTIKIDPGTYREQIHVTSPNITLESNGGNRDNTKITWYYGIGYKYYSTVNSLYDPYADYDKYEKGDVIKYWGSAVVTERTATGFNAKDICFENSFNKYMTDEEISDGVEVNGREAIKVARKENTNVDTRTATERAAALVNYADKTEFLNCSFIGSQDTLYTCNVEYSAYYKNCYIEGQTDYIYGNGDVIFDGCELNWCGYDGTEAGGYITAQSADESHPVKVGYVFRNCIITGNKERTVAPGMFGRMWGKGATVKFIDTQLENPNYLNEVGWGSMSVAPTAETVSLMEYNTTYNGQKVDTSKRIAGVVDSINADDYTVEKVFISDGWTPNYYTAESTEIPEIIEGPSAISNGDLNAPNPGETLTLSYKLNDACANSDTSRISWYAVSEGYDATSLETILQASTLLYTTASYKTVRFQIPMECSGKYIMAVVTPITVGGKVGTPKYYIDTEKLVSGTWSNPDNIGEIAPGSGINIYLAGDSTVKDYSANGMYNSGKIQNLGSWGEFLQDFFDKDFVTVNNYAQGGRSARIFINEGNLDKIKANIKEGDYLFMQFGHNDCANGKSYYEDRFVPLYAQPNGTDVVDGVYPTVLPTEELKVATPDAYISRYGEKWYSWDCGATYKGYLQEYINVALEKKAIPVIVSPVARMYYNSDGNIKTHHDSTATDYAPTINYKTSNNAYVTACKQLYDENIKKGNKVLYLDGYNLTETMFVDAWKASSNNTNGLAMMGTGGDSTHCNKVGGVIEAGLFAKWIQDADLSISKYVIQPTTVYGENADGQYIFTIKDKVFNALDNSYIQNSYTTNYGQQLFDSIGGNSLATTYSISGKTNLTSGTINLLDTNDARVASAEIKEDGTYTVTFTTAADISANIYKVKVDGYLAVELQITVSESDASAFTAQDINFEEEIIINNVSLDFSNEDTLALYETNAASTFKDGVYQGIYTNEEKQEFDVSVFQNAIMYFNSTASYGTKLNAKTPLFAFKADGNGMYTINITSAATGSGTVNLYTSSDCTNSIASVEVPSGSSENLVYKKTTDEPETLYFAASVASNIYVPKITIKKEALPEDKSMNFKGMVLGIESDDTDVYMTFKGTTDSKTISLSDYQTNGVELIVGETYNITAAGSKGYYNGAAVVTDESGTADIVLTRVIFDFPLDIAEYFDDFNSYLTAMGYGSKNVVDAYSGITVYNGGMVMFNTQYGAKTNAYDFISFSAKKTGKCTVLVDVTASNSDKIQLKVNGVATDAVDALAGSTVTIEANVSEGDVITISTPTRSNLYYKRIDVSYE